MCVCVCVCVCVWEREREREKENTDDVSGGRVPGRVKSLQTVRGLVFTLHAFCSLAWNSAARVRTRHIITSGDRTPGRTRASTITRFTWVSIKPRRAEQITVMSELKKNRLFIVLMDLVCVLVGKSELLLHLHLYLKWSEQMIVKSILSSPATFNFELLLSTEYKHVQPGVMTVAVVITERNVI